MQLRFYYFVINMNRVLKEHYVAFEIIKTTGPTIGSQLFNNFDVSNVVEQVCDDRCFICKNSARGDPKSVVSSVTKTKLHQS